MSLELIRVDPDDVALVDRAFALQQLLSANDDPDAWPEPTRIGYDNHLRRGWDGEPPRVFVATDGEALVGQGAIHASRRDNLESAWLDISVRPELRRRGIGSEILDRLAELALTDGRTIQGVDSWEQNAAGAAFAEQRGFTRRSVDAARRHLLGAPDAVETAAALATEAAEHAAAYELVRYAGRVPDGVLPGLVAVTAAINDAPTDDLEIEDDVITEQRIREYEDATLAARRLYRLVARHRETGELAGHTVVAVEADRPTQGWQHDTAVLPSHRGHRLGMLLKASMVGWLADTEPALENVITWNAASNDPMISVNEALGYELIGRAVQFQRRVERPR